jgi:hypothetical protein
MAGGGGSETSKLLDRQVEQSRTRLYRVCTSVTIWAQRSTGPWNGSLLDASRHAKTGELDYRQTCGRQQFVVFLITAYGDRGIKRELLLQLPSARRSEATIASLTNGAGYLEGGVSSDQA